MMVMLSKDIIETLRARRAVVFLRLDDASCGVSMWEYDDHQVFLIPIDNSSVEWEHAVQLKNRGWNYAINYYDHHEDYRLSQFVAHGWCGCSHHLEAGEMHGSA